MRVPLALAVTAIIEGHIGKVPSKGTNQTTVSKMLVVLGFQAS